MNKKVITSILILSLLFLFNLTVFAEQSNEFLNKETTPEDSMFSDNRYYVIDDGLPKATTDDIVDWADRKGFEIVGLLQKIAQPFAIMVFIGSAFMSLFGILGNGHLVSKGVTGMIIAVIIYAVVLYAPEIMDIFLAWVKN